MAPGLAAQALESAPDQERATIAEQPPSLRSIFEEYAPFVWRATRRLGVSEADVEDVCQEIFLAVDRQLAGFEGRSSIRTWIYAITVRQVMNYKRRAFRRYESPSAAPPDAGRQADQARSLELRRAAAALDQLLERMDPGKRQVFVLFELEQLPMDEVAEALGCALPTAYARLRAARAQLKTAARALGVLE